MSEAKRRAKVSASQEVNEDEEYYPNEEIQVDFEGRTPQDSDYHGIRTLLKQLFLKAHVNLSELSNMIIAQNYIGSIIKQADLEMGEDDEEEDQEGNDVFGVTTVVPINHQQDSECVHQIRQLLTNLAEEHAPDATKQIISNVLTSNCALFLNERLVNIPPQISAPLFESLKNEIHKAKQGNKTYNFDYYILICKLYKPDLTKKSNKKKNLDSSTIWSNAEEEIIESEALCSFEFTVETESDSGLTGNWLEEDNALRPYRKVLIINGNKFDQIVDTVKAYVS